MQPAPFANLRRLAVATTWAARSSEEKNWFCFFLGFLLSSFFFSLLSLSALTEIFSQMLSKLVNVSERVVSKLGTPHSRNRVFCKPFSESMDVLDDATIAENRRKRLASIPATTIVAHLLTIHNLRSWIDQRGVGKPQHDAALLETAANANPDNQAVVWLRDFFREEKNVAEEYSRMRAEKRQEAPLIDLYARHLIAETWKEAPSKSVLLLFREAAELGYVPSMVEAAQTHETKEEASKWYRRAAEMGEPWALLERASSFASREEQRAAYQRAAATRLPFARRRELKYFGDELSIVEELERQADILFDEVVLGVPASRGRVARSMCALLLNKDTFWPDSLRYSIGKIFEEFRAYGVERIERHFNAEEEWAVLMQEHEWFLRRVATFRTAALAFLWAARQLQLPLPRDVALMIAKQMFAARKEFDE